MRTRTLVIWITFLALFAMAARISLDNDTWWHLRSGQWIIENQAIPRVDPFSYTRSGQPWPYPGWLVQVPMVWLYHWLGPGGLNMWTAGMVTLAFFFIWKSMAGGPLARAFILVLAAAATGVYWAARPYLVTFVLSACFLWVLDTYRWQRDAPSTRRLWLLTILMVVWANSHGGFITGFLIWGVYWVESLGSWLWIKFSTDPGLRTSDASSLRESSLAFQRLSWIGLSLVGAVCLNPHGPVMLLYPFKTVGIEALRDYIQEWQSPDFHSLQVQPFAWLILLLLASVGFSARRMAFSDFALTAGFAYLGLLAGRNIALFGLAAPMAISRGLEPTLSGLGERLRVRLDWQRPPSPPQKLLNSLLAGLLLIAVVAKCALVFPEPANRLVYSRGLPVQAVAYIQQKNPPGRLFNSYNWGGYLLWALPAYPVFIDGRTDLYDDEIIGAWLRVVRAEPGWQQVLDDWGVRLVLLEADMPVVGALARAGWQPLYQDEMSVLYGR